MSRLGVELAGVGRRATVRDHWLGVESSRFWV